MSATLTHSLLNSNHKIGREVPNLMLSYQPFKTKHKNFHLTTGREFMPHLAIPRPQSNEYAPFYANYIAGVSEPDASMALRQQIKETVPLLENIPETRGSFRYAPDKWTIKEVIGHMSDVERVMAYRALRIARADATPLAGFEQDDYVRAAHFEARTLPSLIKEFENIRGATLAFFEGLEEAAFIRTGTANQVTFSVRALAYIIAGHERHHLKVLREKYHV